MGDFGIDCHPLSRFFAASVFLNQPNVRIDSPMQTLSAMPTSFSDYRKLLKYHWLPAGIVFLSVLGLFTASAYLQKPTYIAESKLKLHRESPVSSLTDLGKSIDQMASVTETSNPVLTEIQVIQSQPVIAKTLEQLHWTLDGTSFKTTNFLANLSVTHIKDADIFKLEYKSHDPKKAAEALNTLMKVYLQNGVRSKQGEVSITRQFIAVQLPVSKKQVEIAENRLREFKQVHRILTLKDQVASAQTRIDDLQKQIADVRAQLANTSAQERVVIGKLGISPQQAIAISTLSQSPEVQDLLTKIQQAQAQLVTERNRLTESHPTVVTLKGNLADLKQLFAQKAAKISGSSPGFDSDGLIGKLRQDLTAELVKLEASQKGFQEEIATLSQSLESYRAQVATLPKLQQQQNELERQLDATQNSYNTLLKQSQETQVASNPALGNARIVSEAVVPDQPNAPRKSLYIATGLILGSVLAFLTLYGLEKLNKSLRTVDEIQKQLDLPILGVIPFAGRRRLRFFASGVASSPAPCLYLADFPTHKVSEACRLLQNNLRSLEGNQPCKVLAVTSAQPQEGKSTVAANLAIALAQNGRSAILVEANFQDPIQQYIWSWPAELGLSEVLTDQTPWRSVVQRIYPNLDLILSGQIKSQAISSLDSRQITILLADLSDHYDFVILDTASLETGADTIRLTQSVDGILLVAQPGRINADSAAFAQQVLAQSRKPVLGLVLNQVLPIHEPHPYYYLAASQPPSLELTAAIPSRLSNDRDRWEETSLDFDQPLLDTEESLDRIPLDQLQTTVEALQKEWLKSARLVREQEEELNLQSQTVREMNERLKTAGEYHRHAASEYERLSLEVQLVDEEERKRLLDETLVGQRRKLLEQQEIVRHYLRVLEQRRNGGTEQGEAIKPFEPRPKMGRNWLKHLRP
jgi:polysaccharide biosynthesis transport protein